MADALQRENRPVPVPIKGLALVDTGASVSCIDTNTARQLKLPVVGTVIMASASHANTPTAVHPIQIKIQNAPVSFGAPRAMCANLANQGFIAIIGRDILSLCTMYYNGPAGQITVSL